MKRTIIAILLLIISFPAFAKTYVIFRYDDFCGDRPLQRKKNLNRNKIFIAEKAVDNLFKKYKMPYVIAISPMMDPRQFSYFKKSDKFISLSADPEKIRFIKNALIENRIEIALHGFSHTNHAKERHLTGEFRERTFEQQLQDINNGKNLLKTDLNIKSIISFVPPFNVWDDNTAKALTDAGFKILSADRNYYYKEADLLTVIPFTGQLWELEEMVNTGNIPKDGIVVALYHPPQIAEIKENNGQYYEGRFFGIKRFDELLLKISEDNNIQVVTLMQLSEYSNDLTSNRYKNSNELWRQKTFWYKLLPGDLLPGTKERIQYLSEKQYYKKILFWRLLLFASIVFLIVIGIGIKTVIKRFLPERVLIWLNYGCLLLLLLNAFLIGEIIYRGYPVTGVRVLPFFLIFGFILPVIINKLKLLIIKIG